jgi:hypothetical protein
MSGDYASVKKWRHKNKKNAAYSKLFMQKRRKHFRKLYLAGEIAYADIPKAYRYFVES